MGEIEPTMETENTQDRFDQIPEAECEATQDNIQNAEEIFGEMDVPSDL